MKSTFFNQSNWFCLTLTSYLLLFIALTIISQFDAAAWQPVQVSGTVLDQNDDPLGGVNVKVKNSATSVATANNGTLTKSLMKRGHS